MRNRSDIYSAPGLSDVFLAANFSANDFSCENKDKNYSIYIARNFLNFNIAYLCN